MTKPRIVSASELEMKLSSPSDLSDLLGASFGAAGLLFTAADLSPAFFDLRSGLAGEAFQKFTNYQVRVALVLPDFDAYGLRFSELAFEHSRHNLIRFFHTETEARAWLNGA